MLSLLSLDTRFTCFTVNWVCRPVYLLTVSGGRRFTADALLALLQTLCYLLYCKRFTADALLALLQKLCSRSSLKLYLLDIRRFTGTLLALLQTLCSRSSLKLYLLYCRRFTGALLALLQTFCSRSSPRSATSTEANTRTNSSRCSKASKA
jgi:hypothetical protein